MQQRPCQALQVAAAAPLVSALVLPSSLLLWASHFGVPMPGPMPVEWFSKAAASLNLGCWAVFKSPAPVCPSMAALIRQSPVLPIPPASQPPWHSGGPPASGRFLSAEMAESAWARYRGCVARRLSRRLLVVPALGCFGWGFRATTPAALAGGGGLRDTQSGDAEAPSLFGCLDI